jgi:chromosome segregation ATPase
VPTQTKPKKTTKPTIEDLEREVKIAEAAVLRAKADVLRLEDRLEKVDIERAAVSTKKLGSKTEAIRMLEELDKERLSLERSLTLATGAVGELEEDLATAGSALDAERDRLADEAERRERQETHQKLLAAEEALQEARKKLAELPGRPGDRIHRRIATILGPWFPPNHRPVVPEPPLASQERSQERVPELTKKGVRS